MKIEELKEHIEYLDFDRRVNEVLPMLKDEYQLYGTVSLIRDMHDCLNRLQKFIEKGVID